MFEVYTKFCVEAERLLSRVKLALGELTEEVALNGKITSDEFSKKVAEVYRMVQETSQYNPVLGVQIVVDDWVLDSCSSVALGDVYCWSAFNARDQTLITLYSNASFTTSPDGFIAELKYHVVVHHFPT